MKKRVKLLTTIASLCLAVALMAFGVYAASSATVAVTSTVTFDVSGDFVGTVTVKAYAVNADGATLDGAADAINTATINYANHTAVALALDPVALDMENLWIAYEVSYVKDGNTADATNIIIRDLVATIDAEDGTLVESDTHKVNGNSEIREGDEVTQDASSAVTYVKFTPAGTLSGNGSWTITFTVELNQEAGEQ